MENFNKLFKDIFFIAFVALLSTIMVFVLSTAPFFELIKNVFSFKLVILNFLPPFLLALFLYGLSGRVKISIVLVSAFQIIFLIINRMKIIYRKDPFKLSDINESLEAVKMVKSSYSPDKFSIILALLFFIFLAILLFFYKTNKLNLSTRATILIISLVIGFFSYKGFYISSNVYNSLKVYGNPFNEIDVYNSMGFNYSFIFKINASMIRPPQNYNKEEYANRDREDRGEEISVLKAQEKPNIVWIMGESFTDFSQNPVFSFDKGNDPNENFKKICNQAPMTGRIVVPGFGGGTGDTEFDVLTGTLTIDTAPNGSYAFNIVKNNTKSLASVLKNIGYNTMAFHPGYEWFYHRNVVYPRLGFDKSSFLENIKNPENKGDYFSEEKFTDIYLDGLKKSLDSKETVFDYAVDIQNHGPYFYDKYGQTLPFNCTKPLTDEAKVCWGSYFIGVKDIDTMLGRVYDFIMSRQEPIIFVFYGDHLPALGEDPDGYKQIGVDMKVDTLEDEITRHSTPFFITANEAGRKYLNVENAKLTKGSVISANFLGSSVLDMLGFTKADNFFEYNSNLRDYMPIISRHFIYTKDATYPKEKVGGEAAQKYMDYRAYEYYRVNQRKK